MDGNLDGLETRSELLQWQPGETLFSLASRQHKLFSNRLAGQTARMLFGRPRRGYQHDFPSGLSAFVRNTGGQLGDVQSIGLERTLLQYYRPFLTDAREQEVLAAMSGDSVAHLKFRLGLLTGRFRAHHPLKACLLCIDEDRAHIGWSWWRIEHQFPGVWICERHRQPLCEALVKANGVERFQWALPDADLLRPPDWPDGKTGDLVERSLTRLARLIVDLVRHGSGLRIDGTTMRALYRASLAARGLCSSSGRVDLSAAAEQFLAHVRPLRSVTELSALAGDMPQARAQLTRLLALQRSGTHPLRHLVMIDWLVGTADELIRRLPMEPPTDQADSIDAKPATSRPYMSTSAPLDRVVELIRHQGLSMRAAADALGVDVQTAMVWAARAGIETARRPKILKDEHHQALVAALRSGAAKAAAASQWGVSVTTITRVLRTVPGLHEQWVEARARATQRASRRRWTQLLLRYGALGVKFMRQESPAAYAWLYRHDRIWLEEHLPAKLARLPTTRVDWDQRDDELSAAVRRAALLVARTLGGRVLRIGHLLLACPELRPKLRRLERLPLTQRAIREAIQASRGRRHFGGEMLDEQEQPG